MSNITTPARQHQRGAATLIVTMVLLFSISIIMLYLNRSILFEQKTSANQLRSTIAMEMAEAGMEWTVGMLNTAYDIDASCNLLSTTDIPFRQKYVQTKWHDATNPSTEVFPATNAFPGCKINTANNIRTCSCPAVPGNNTTAVASLDTTELPGFTVSFSTEGTAGDQEAVRVTVTGCTARKDGAACTPEKANESDKTDATATVTSIIKMRPLLRAAPAAPLTCGKSCEVGGSYNIINKDVVTGGVLVNAGTDIIKGNGTGLTSIPGQPGENALVGNDTSLLNLASSDTNCSASAMFSAYFGSTIAQFAASPLTKTITDSDAIDKAYADGWRSFYFPTGFARNNKQGNLGTPSDPVTLVSAAGFDINGNIDIYGMIFANKANFNDGGTGTADIHGALVTCADYRNNGNGTLEYDADILKNVRRSTGVFVRVPGSWTDRCTANPASTPAIICN